MAAKITLHEMSPDEFKNLIDQQFQNQFENMNSKLQKAFGEDDLVSTGTACRLLGISAKVLKVLRDEGHFSVYHHLKERRYNRGELLEYRDKYKTNKKRG